MGNIPTTSPAIRPIIPTTLAELPGLVELSSAMGQSHEYYIAEISSLSAWRDADLHGARVWCPVNSFNIPSPSAERGTILALQGAGDLLFLTSFIPQLGPTDDISITTYDKFAPLLDNWPAGVYKFPYSSGPAELDIRRLSHSHEYSIHHPNAVKPLMMQAIRAGWDHYDWMGLCLGVKPQNRNRGWLVTTEHDTRVARDAAMSAPVDSRRIAIHLTASMPDRSCTELLPALLSLERPSDRWHFFLLGGQETASTPDLPGRVTNLAGRLSYLQTFELMYTMQAVIAVDSVVLHMANLAGGVPVLGIYRSTPPTWAGPRNVLSDTMHYPGAPSPLLPGSVAEWLRSQVRLDKPINKGG